MKKNFFFSMLAVAGMLFATSCQQDLQPVDAPQSDYFDASFSISATEGMGTKAIGNASMVNVVTCAVFDANGDEMPLRQDVPFENGQATYNIRLAKGQDYRLAFFAYNKEAAAYDVSDMKNITVEGDQSSNNESRDAFTKYIDITAAQTMNSINQTVTLKRPFAQLNMGIDAKELQDAANSGVSVSKTKVVVSGVYNAFNAYKDAVVENAAPVTMEFALAAIPNESLVVNNEAYHYLAMNYILVGADLDLLPNVEFVWETADNKTNNPTTKFINVPVQRNYRTNIIGKLLTNPADFTIEIDAAFDGDIDHTVIANAADLQSALDAVPAGETAVLHLGADIKGDVIEHQRAGRHIVIEGNGYKYDGTIKIHNGSNYNDGSITINEVNFETAATKLDFILAKDFGVEAGVTRRYSNNIFVTNCSFVALTANEGVVGVQVNATRNLQVLNCYANGLHSLVQAQSCGEDVIVKDAKIEGGKNGIAFKQVKNVAVENVRINAAAYGIRFDGNVDNYAITLTDVNVEANQPFIVRKMTGKNNTIALEGTNTLNTTEGYQIVITNGSDDEAYVVPTGTYKLTGAEDFIVYPNANEAAADLRQALTDDSQSLIEVEAPVSAPGTAFNIARDVEIDFQENELNAGSTATSRNYALEVYEGTTVIKNANFTRAGVYAEGDANVVFENGVINHKPERSSRYIFCAQENSTITIKNGTFNNDRAKNAYFWVAGDATVIVEGGVFAGVASNNKVVLTENGQLIIKGGTFNFDPTTWVPANGYAVTKNGSTWTVAAI